MGLFGNRVIFLTLVNHVAIKGIGKLPKVSFEIVWAVFVGLTRIETENYLISMNLIYNEILLSHGITLPTTAKGDDGNDDAQEEGGESLQRTSVPSSYAAYFLFQIFH